MIGNYEERAFPVFRNPTIDTLDIGRRKHHIPFLLEADITDARALLQVIKQRTGERPSFTGWVITCVAQAVSEHNYMHALRKGRRRLVLFDDVDVSIIVERQVDRSAPAASSLPMPYVIRRCNSKSLNEIHQEIRSAQHASLHPGEVQLGAQRNAALTRMFNAMPRFLRYLLVWRRLKDPFFVKQNMGTVAVTSVVGSGVFNNYGWAIPIGLHPLIVALGSVARKPGLVGDEIKIREYLGMTLLFDHDVTDGAPVARFVQRLVMLLEQGYGLE